MFRRTLDLPGDIVEFGVYRGASLMTWANLLEIRNMGDRQKQVFGFDNFSGFTEIAPEDGKEDPRVGKVMSGFNSDPFEDILRDAIAIFDQDRFIPHKPRIVWSKATSKKRAPFR